MLFYNQCLDNQSPSLEYEVLISLPGFNCLAFHSPGIMIASFQ